MDKRILILIAVFNAVAISVFFMKRATGNNAPAVRFTIDKTLIVAGDSISYADNTPGATGWKWDFGDGEPSYKQSGKHTYFDLGKHKVVLSVSGTTFGPILDSSKEIVVRSAPKPDTVKQPAPVAVEPPKPAPAPAPTPAPKPEPHKQPAPTKPRPHHSGGDVNELPPDDGPAEIKK